MSQSVMLLFPSQRHQTTHRLVGLPVSMPVTFSRHDVMFLAELVTAGAIAADDDDVSDAGKDAAEAISSTSFSQ